MEVSWPQLKPYIESAPFLSDTEKEMLLDILPHWPKSSLGDLLEALHFGLENLANVPSMLQDAYGQGKKILFEGAQGSLLDVIYGT